MKTRAEWFATLPKEIEQKAIEHTKDCYGNNFDTAMKRKYECLDFCIVTSFLFHETQEDWFEIIEKYDPNHQ